MGEQLTWLEWEEGHLQVPKGGLEIGGWVNSQCVPEDF